MADQYDELLTQYGPKLPRAELRAGDPSVFREPTLLNMLLGRYAPSGLLAQYYNPETREGAASARRWGGLMDDGLLSLLGIRSPRGADRATGAMLDKRAERLGSYGDDIMKADVNWPKVLESGYPGSMRPMPGSPQRPAMPGNQAANDLAKDIRLDNPYMDAHIQQQWQRYVSRPGSPPPEMMPIGKAEFDAARFLMSANGNVAEARAMAREMGYGDDVFRVLDRYAKPVMTSIPGGKLD